jgi:sugar-specific transcriptional regulator TrmB
MTSKDLHNRLSSLGLTKREAKVYLALITNGVNTAASLQNSVGIPRTKIYEILKSLSYKGLCSERRTDKVIRYDAVSPQIALSQFTASIQERLTDAHKLTEELQILYSESEKQIEPFEYIEIIHGNINVHRKYLDLIKSAESEILAFVRPPFAFTTEEMQHEQEDEYLRCRRKGIKIRHIFEHNEDSPDMIIDRINYDVKNNSNFRIQTNLPLKMIVFDRTTLFIVDEDLSSAESELTVSIIKQEATVKGYVTLFDFIWNQSMKYDEWIKTQNSNRT